MIVLEIALFGAALLAAAALFASQFLTQLRELRFYRNNGWDFTVDSGMDKIDQRMTYVDLRLTPQLRLYVFRPAFLVMLVAIMAAMLFSLL